MRLLNPKFWYVAIVGDMYRVTSRVSIPNGATFIHQMYVRAKSREQAAVKAARSYTPGLFVEVKSAVNLGRMI